jgi:hypothetical protein
MSSRCTMRLTLALTQRWPCSAQYTRPATRGSSSIQATVAGSRAGGQWLESRRLGGQQPVAARHIHLTVQHDAGAVARQHGRGTRAWSSTWATVAVCPLGRCHGLAGLHAARGHTAPEHAAALVVSADEENFSTHCTGKANASVVSAGWRAVAPAAPAGWAPVAAPAGLGRHHVPALQGRDRHDGAHGDARGGAKACSAALMAEASAGSATASSLFTANTMLGTRSRLTSSEWRRVCGSSSRAGFASPAWWRPPAPRRRRHCWRR